MNYLEPIMIGISMAAIVVLAIVARNESVSKEDQAGDPPSKFDCIFEKLKTWF